MFSRRRCLHLPGLDVVPLRQLSAETSTTRFPETVLGSEGLSLGMLPEQWMEAWGQTDRVRLDPGGGGGQGDAVPLCDSEIGMTRDTGELSTKGSVATGATAPGHSSQESVGHRARRACCDLRSWSFLGP